MSNNCGVLRPKMVHSSKVTKGGVARILGSYTDTTQNGGEIAEGESRL
jgi:hypothetical protein